MHVRIFVCLTLLAASLISWGCATVRSFPAVQRFSRPDRDEPFPAPPVVWETQFKSGELWAGMEPWRASVLIYYRSRRAELAWISCDGRIIWRHLLSVPLERCGFRRAGESLEILAEDCRGGVLSWSVHPSGRIIKAVFREPYRWEIFVPLQHHPRTGPVWFRGFRYHLEIGARGSGTVLRMRITGVRP